MHEEQNKIFYWFGSQPKYKDKKENLISCSTQCYTKLHPLQLTYAESYSERMANEETTYWHEINVNFHYPQFNILRDGILQLEQMGFKKKQIKQALIDINSKVKQLIETLFHLRTCNNYGKYELLATSKQLRAREFQRLFSNDIANDFSSLQESREMKYQNMTLRAKTHTNKFKAFLNQLNKDPKFKEYLFICFLKDLAHEPSFLDYLPHINFYYLFVLSIYILLDLGISGGILYAGFLCNLLDVTAIFLLFMITPILISFLTSAIISANYSESIVSWIDSKDKLFNTDLTKMFYEIDKELEPLDEEIATTQKKLS